MSFGQRGCLECKFCRAWAPFMGAEGPGFSGPGGSWWSFATWKLWGEDIFLLCLRNRYHRLKGCVLFRVKTRHGNPPGHWQAGLTPCFPPPPSPPHPHDEVRYWGQWGSAEDLGTWGQSLLLMRCWHSSHRWALGICEYSPKTHGTHGSKDRMRNLKLRFHRGRGIRASSCVRCVLIFLIQVFHFCISWEKAIF